MGKVKAVPEGYATVTPFLNINGADAAIDLYKQAFGAKERSRLMRPDGKVAMVELEIGSSIVRISDAVLEPPTSSTLQLYVEDADGWWQRAMAAGLDVALPLQDQFFGDRFGILKDRFGNRWGIATHVRDVPEAEIRRRAADTANIH
jgi:uncharacterized glyoxalase superfamily protein PhnB